MAYALRNSSPRLAARPGFGESPDCPLCAPAVLRHLPQGAAGRTRVSADATAVTRGDRRHAVLCVLRGMAAIFTILPRGRRPILDFALPGEVFDIGFEGGALPVTVQALEDLEFCSLSRDELEMLTDRAPGLALRLSRLAGMTRDPALNRVAMLGQQSAEARLARLLVELCVRRTRRWPIAPGTEVALPLTQEHLADATGLSTAYVCRTLGALARRRVLSHRWQRLTVIDPPALLAAASLAPDMVGAWLSEIESARRALAGPHTGTIWQ